MRKTRERKRKNLRLATIEVSLNAYEAAKRSDFSGIIPVLNAWERFDQMPLDGLIYTLNARLGGCPSRTARHVEQKLLGEADV